MLAIAFVFSMVSQLLRPASLPAFDPSLHSVCPSILSNTMRSEWPSGLSD
jgi:hypothetical protein